MSDGERPTVFGREMVRQAIPTPLFVLSLHGDGGDCLVVYGSAVGAGWAAYAEVGGHTYGVPHAATAQGAADALEARVRSLVESLGPLVGWQHVPDDFQIVSKPPDACPSCGATPFRTSEGACVQCAYGHK